MRFPKCKWKMAVLCLFHFAYNKCCSYFHSSVPYLLHNTLDFEFFVRIVFFVVCVKVFPAFSWWFRLRRPKLIITPPPFVRSSKSLFHAVHFLYACWLTLAVHSNLGLGTINRKKMKKAPILVIGWFLISNFCIGIYMRSSSFFRHSFVPHRFSIEMNNGNDEKWSIFKWIVWIAAILYLQWKAINQLSSFENRLPKKPHKIRKQRICLY